jgi:hypothetical protein
MNYPFISPFAHYQLSCVKQFFARSKWKNLLDKNIEFKNSFRGKRCFILGTAPSIMDFDLNKIKNECLIAINEFHHHPDFDQVFNSHPENKFIVLPPTHSSITEDEILKILSEMQHKISRQITLFLGLDNYQLNYHQQVSAHHLFQEHQLRYFNTGIQTQLGWYRFSKKHWDLTRNIWSSSVGSVYALIIAIYMGFDEIYLLGIDHSYLSFTDPVAYRFYGDHPNLKKRNEIERNEMEHQKSRNTIILEGTHLAFEQYTLIAKHSKSQVYNLSKQSIIDIFPKKDFPEL